MKDLKLNFFSAVHLSKIKSSTIKNFHMYKNKFPLKMDLKSNAFFMHS